MEISLSVRVVPIGWLAIGDGAVPETASRSRGSRLALALQRAQGLERPRHFFFHLLAHVLARNSSPVKSAIKALLIVFLRIRHRLLSLSIPRPLRLPRFQVVRRQSFC